MLAAKFIRKHRLLTDQQANRKQRIFYIFKQFRVNRLIMNYFYTYEHSNVFFGDFTSWTFSVFYILYAKYS